MLPHWGNNHLGCPSPSTQTFLEAKACKGMHQVCIEKSPDGHLSIHPR